jgi:uncharacterized cupin superfamily protein
MGFRERVVKGLGRCLVDEEIDATALSIHISEVGPGTSAHPPHAHPGLEAFYLLEGEGEVRVGDDSYALRANEAILFDPSKLHGLVNKGSSVMRYMVIIAKAR